VSIHKFLFEDIYPFAGLFRTENIAKDYFQFAEWEYIENELTRLLSELKSENFLANLTKEKFAERLAYYWAELNVLHPFREVFILKKCKEFNLLDFEKINDEFGLLNFAV
jgi:cell filamentation protein